MAKKFIDVTVNTDKADMVNGDGTSLTLTNSVRVLYDDTVEPAALFTALTRVRDRITEGAIPAA
jgi:hypothetical protein